MPERVKAYPGKNTGKSIAGGDIRIFRVKFGENNIDEMPSIIPDPNPLRRGLALTNIISLKREILMRPTFFQHFDRVSIDEELIKVK